MIRYRLRDLNPEKDATEAAFQPVNDELKKADAALNKYAAAARGE